MLVESAQLDHVHPADLEVEHLEIFLLMLRVVGLGKRHYAELQIPADQQLRRRLAIARRHRAPTLSSLRRVARVNGLQAWMMMSLSRQKSSMRGLCPKGLHSTWLTAGISPVRYTSSSMNRWSSC